MYTARLIQQEELEHQLYIDLIEDYVEWPSFNTMQSELKGYDIVDLSYCLQNWKTLRDYLLNGPRCCLDAEQREWLILFIAGWISATSYALDQCQVLYTN